MTITVEPIGPVLGARVTGFDLRAGITDHDFAALLAAFHEHSVLVLPGQPMDDERQVAFSARFGPLERTVASNPAGGTPFARQSNVDLSTGALIPPHDRRMSWDNRASLHRATPYDATRHRRLMQRTTVSAGTPANA